MTFTQVLKTADSKLISPNFFRRFKVLCRHLLKLLRFLGAFLVFELTQKSFQLKVNFHFVLVAEGYALFDFIYRADRSFVWRIFLGFFEKILRDWRFFYLWHRLFYITTHWLHIVQIKTYHIQQIYLIILRRLARLQQNPIQLKYFLFNPQNSIILKTLIYLYLRLLLDLFFIPPSNLQFFLIYFFQS